MASKNSPTPAIQVSKLSKNYGKLKALDHLDLTIQPGEFFALLGPNGAGKTTFINIITGLANKKHGSVKVFGHDTTTEYKLARKRIGLVPQEMNMDKFEQVRRALLLNAGYFALDKKTSIARVDSLLHELNLWSKRASPILTLSGGMKRKLMIARALLHNPDILILDEPTAGVDVESRKAIWKYLSNLNEKQNKTILLTTHYIEEAEKLCSKIAIINKGKIIANKKKEAIMQGFGSKKIILTLTKEVKNLNAKAFSYPITSKGNKLIVRVPELNFNYQNFIKRVSDLPIKNIETRSATLEEIFIELTNQK